MEGNRLQNERFDYSKYKAIEHYTKALNKIRNSDPQSNKLKQIEAETLDKLGDLFDKMRLRNEARKYYFEAFEIRKEHEQKDIDQSLLRLTKIYYRFGYEEGSLIKSIEYAKRALSNIYSLNEAEVAETHYWLASAYFNLKYEEDIDESIYLDSAFREAQFATQLLNKTNLVRLQINVNNLLSSLNISIGSFDNAYSKLQQNLKLLKKLDSTKAPIEQAYYASTYSRLENFFHSRNQLDSALYYSNLRYAKVVGLLMQNERETSVIITEDYRTDKQLDQAEETAFLASQKAKTYGIVVVILLLVLAISYLIFLQTIQRKKLENLQAVVLGEEKERKRLAKDLHDGIGVLLTSIRMRLSSFEDKVDDQKAYHDSLEQIDDACSEVRRVSHNLSPASLEKLGLNEALHDLADQVNLSGNMRMVEQIKLPERLLSEEEEVLVYRIVQELINNSLKYAEANEITLSLKQEASGMKLHYRDNGKGFDKEIIKPGIGLKSIASRIDILKGKMSFQSQLGKGTEYEISIPING